ncbi:hypothetical protein ABIB25_003875 [Nakamurella sp. UYEF19]|uniref:hypothetical protein n=1 Tax=Nakamurella sp. UYEF19 TaxID=1756392 RepID=UPI0033912A14
MVTSQYLIQAFWIACRSLISCAERPAVLSVGVVRRVVGVFDMGVVAGGLLVGAVLGEGVVGGVVEGVVADETEDEADDGEGAEEARPVLPGAKDPLDPGAGEDKEEVSGKAVPPGVRSAVLVGPAVLVDVQPVTSAVVTRTPAITRSTRERQSIRLPPTVLVSRL